MPNFFARNLLYLRNERDMSQNEVAIALKIGRSTYANYENGDTEPKFDIFQDIVKLYNIDLNKLILEDLSLKNDEDHNVLVGHIEDNNASLRNQNNRSLSTRLFPLVSLEAIAGFGNQTFSIQQSDIEAMYQIPDFTDVDFMIRVKGGSMSPKYHSGDIVACRKLTNPSFIQWNKVYVLATKDQGIIIKRIKPSSKPKHYQAVSENKDYEPFDLPVEEITGIALVIGTVRLE